MTLSVKNFVAIG